MRSRAQTVVPIVVACAFFMENFDGTVIATALPAIARSLHSEPVSLSIAMTAYLVSLAVFIPVSGWLADRYGTSTTFRAAIVVFTLASVFCGLATSLPQLVVARVVQGMGGAMMLPVGRLIILRSFDRSQFVQAMSYVTTPALIGPVFGPPVGGFLTTYLSWRWIFFINVPIGILGIVLATMWVKNTQREAARPFDVLGFALTGIGVAALMGALDVLVRDAGAVLAAALLVVGVAFACAAIVHARRFPWPLIDLSLFRLQPFASSMGPGCVFRAVAFALPFLLPLLFQIGFGITAFVSGLMTCSAAGGALMMKAWAPRILRCYGFRAVLATNGVLTGSCAMAIAAFDTATAVVIIVLIVLAVLAFGFGRSLQLSALNAFTFAGVPTEQMSAATSLSGMLQQLAAATGIGASALLLRGAVAFRGAPIGTLDALDIRRTIAVTALVSIAAGIAFLRLDRESGVDISGHRRIPAGGEGSA